MASKAAQRRAKSETAFIRLMDALPASFVGGRGDEVVVSVRGALRTIRRADWDALPPYRGEP